MLLKSGSSSFWYEDWTGLGASLSVGPYSARKGYHWLLERTFDGPNLGPRRWVWSIQGPEKIHFLIWLALHNSLPTREVLLHRNITTIGSCPRCPLVQESISHCLRGCPVAKDLWTRMGFQIDDDFLHAPLRLWLMRFSRHSPASFLPTLWWVWRWRNNCIFYPNPWSLEFVLRQTLLLQHDLLLSANDMCSDSSLLMKLWWKTPRVGFTKLNVGGSLNPSDGSMASGGVLRSSTGAWIWGFSGFHGFGDVVHAELLALKIGLLHAWDTEFKRLLCETNSLEVIHLL
ncbi:Ribonuclease H-like superfamily [Sesbania bispinosa]|nr:Ribonuclease H-like superfamily [Sesbania bispinosa]